MTKQQSTRRERLLLAGILVGALALRLLHWLWVRDEPFVASLAVDSKEYERWAQGIVAGDWIGRDAFFQAPLYPYTLAVLHLVFGKGLTAIYLAQSLVAVAACWALHRAGRLMVDVDTGLAAAGMLAIAGPGIFHDVLVLKESFAVSAACFLLWALASARVRGTLRAWLVAGLVCGGLALLRENALLVAPLLAALAFLPSTPETRSSPRARFGAAATFVLGIALTLAPVAVRNGLVSGDWLPTTSQGGVNLYIGNHAGASGAYDPLLPGPHDPARERQAAHWLAERDAGRELSPAEVSSFWASRAISWATSHPGDFLKLLGNKLVRYWRFYEQPDTVDYYWMRTRSPVLRLPLLEFGGAAILAGVGFAMAWSRRRLLDLAPAWVLALGWMVSTVAFFVFSRYRLPTLPALLLLAAIPVTALIQSLTSRQRRRSLALGALVLAAWLAPRAFSHEPQRDTLHLNLAALAVDEGRLDDAAAEYRTVLELDPKQYLAHLQLGRIAAQEQRMQDSIQHLSDAARLSPGSPEAQAELGRVLLAFGRQAEAVGRLEAAVSLDPSNADALHDLAVSAAMQGDIARASALNARVLAIRPDDALAQDFAAELARRLPR